MKLVICEKKSQAEAIAGALNVPTFNRLYFNNDQYVITFLQGHVLSLKIPGEYDPKFRKWSLDDLPIFPKKFVVVENDSTSFLLENIDSLVSNNIFETVVCATDAGREGELIFRYVYAHLKLDLPIERLWISSLTDESILKGFDNLKSGDLYKNLFKAAYSRACADWLIGMNLSRYYSLLSNSKVRVGRVTTPTLWMIVDRDNSIDSHKQHFTYSIEAKYSDFIFKYEKEELSNWNTLYQAQSYYDMVKDFKSATFKEPVVKEKTINPPKLFSLDTLQQVANEKFGFTAKKTLELAQSLYDKHKAISYPRTSSEYLTDDMIDEVKTIAKCHDLEMDFNNFQENQSRYFNNEKVDDHHAIIPTNKTPLHLTEDENNIFNIVLQRFVFMFTKSAVVSEYTLILYQTGHRFVSKFNVLKSKGFLITYPLEDLKKYKEQQIVEHLPKVDELIGIDSIEIKTHEVSAPKRFNDSTLLNSMKHAEKYLEGAQKASLKDVGIGTQATRADIIENLVISGYVERKGKSLASTKVGKTIISFMPPLLTQPALTADWEIKLSLIENGEYQPSTFLNEIKASITSLLSANVDSEIYQIRKEDNVLCSCPNCSGSILDKKSFYGCSNYKEGCLFTLNKKVASKTLTTLQAKKLIENKETGIIKGFKSAKGVFDSKLYLSILKDGKTKISFYKTKEIQ
jgi:DNA topoisomerase-3